MKETNGLNGVRFPNSQPAFVKTLPVENQSENVACGILSMIISINRDTWEVQRLSIHMQLDSWQSQLERVTENNTSPGTFSVCSLIEFNFLAISNLISLLSSYNLLQVLKVSGNIPSPKNVFTQRFRNCLLLGSYFLLIRQNILVFMFFDKYLLPVKIYQQV